MNKLLKNTGLFLLILLVNILIVSVSLFFIKISITKYHLIISFILTSIIYYLLNKKEGIKNIIYTILISLVILIVSLFISGFMYDRSSDGNTYHKDSVGVLYEGFNPIYESSYDFISKRDDISKDFTDYTIWIDHYAKANWIIEANFYSITDNIECGKAINIVSLYIVFSLLLSGFIDALDKKKSIILSLIIVFTPVVSSQIFTFYNDMLVSLYLFLGIFSLIKLDKDIDNKNYWIIYILSFIILFNTKFNGMGYLLVFSFMYVLRYLYKAYRNKEFLSIFKKMCIIFIPLFIVSLYISYPTYIKNTIDHSNPFFPLYDENGEDIITEQQPKIFLEYNSIEKLFYATFSKVNNLRENDNLDLKIPFTVYKSELTPSMSNDLRISGWGIFFSGLLLISIYIFIKYFKQYKKDSFILYTLFITLLLLIFMGESWWARYTPHFYLFIIFSLYILFRYNNKKIFNYLYSILIIINCLLPLLGNTYYTFKNSITINKDLNNLSGKKIILKENNYHGIVYNLKDNNIKFTLNSEISGKELYYHYLEYEME